MDLRRGKYSSAENSATASAWMKMKAIPSPVGVTQPVNSSAMLPIAHAALAKHRPDQDACRIVAGAGIANRQPDSGQAPSTPRRLVATWIGC
jgi:hypothetical protein